MREAFGGSSSEPGLDQVVNATGELLRELTLDPSRDYQPTGTPNGPARRTQRCQTAEVLRHHKFFVAGPGFEREPSGSEVESRPQSAIRSLSWAGMSPRGASAAACRRSRHAKDDLQAVNALRRTADRSRSRRSSAVLRSSPGASDCSRSWRATVDTGRPRS